MRILLALALFLFGIGAGFAGDDVGIILKTTNDRAPIRIKNDVSAYRFTHLRQGIFLYSTGVFGDFYRVSLGNGTPYFIEKKYVEETPGEKARAEYTIKNYKTKEHKEFWTLRIKFNEVPVYQTVELDDGGLVLNLFNISKSIKARKIKFFELGRVNNTVQFKFNSVGPLAGYEVEKDGQSLVLKIRKMPEIDKERPLEGLKIVLDAGHGGSEPGACANGIIEKNLNLQITKKLATKLEDAGAKVYMTREKDVDMGLYERVDFAKEKDALVLLSIHGNSLPNPKDIDKKHGVGVYFYNKQSKPLAAALQNSLLGATGFRDDGVNYASFALTRPTEMLSVLVETGYLIHTYEAKMLKDSAFQDKIAAGIVEGLEKYFRGL